MTLRKTLARLKRNENAATAIEYALIVGLIFLVIVATLNVISSDMTNMYNENEEYQSNDQCIFDGCSELTPIIFPIFPGTAEQQLKRSCSTPFLSGILRLKPDAGNWGFPLKAGVLPSPAPNRFRQIMGTLDVIGDREPAGFPGLHLLNPVIRRMSALGQKQTF